MGASAVRILVIGTAAGLLAAYAMEQAQAGLSRLHEQTGDPTPPSKGPPATERAADLVSELTRGRPVSTERRAAAGRAVHYATGAGLGVLYAFGVARYRGVARDFGILYGVIVSLLLDEGVVPALQLSEPPAQTPLSRHMDGVAAHLAYGVTLEAARLTLDTVLPEG